MSDVFQAGTTSHSIEILIRDPATMQGMTGLLYTTSGLSLAYSRDRAAPVAITLVTQTATGAYSSGGFVAKSATLTPGLYRLDVPNAAFVAGADKVRVFWTGGGVLDDGVDIDITAFDPLVADKDGYTLTSGERAAIRTEIDTNSTQLAGLATLATALSTSVNNLNNLSALANMLAPVVMEVPATGSRVYLCRLTIKDTTGHLEDLDALPTLAAVNAAGTDRSANLSAATRMSLGVYSFTYTLAAGSVEEGVIISATGTAAGSARRADSASSIVSVDTANSLTSILTKLGVPAGASLAADIAAIATHATAIDTRLPATPADETLIINATNALGSAIGALNNLSSAQAQTAAAAALTAQLSAIADKVLLRNQKGGADGPASQSVSAALAGGLMNFSITAGVLTVHNADGTTAYTRNLSRAQLDAIVAAA